MTEGARSWDRRPPHGTMAEEAAKLADLAGLWLTAQSYRSARGADDVWAGATAEQHEPAECRGCPVCRVRRAFREVSPEVYEHLADAVSSLGAAFRALDEARRRDGGR